VVKLSSFLAAGRRGGYVAGVKTFRVQIPTTTYSNKVLTSGDFALEIKIFEPFSVVYFNIKQEEDGAQACKHFLKRIFPLNPVALRQSVDVLSNLLVLLADVV
jgi:hypothetical protein